MREGILVVFLGKDIRDTFSLALKRVRGEVLFYNLMKK